MNWLAIQVHKLSGPVLDRASKGEIRDKLAGNSDLGNLSLYICERLKQVYSDVVMRDTNEILNGLKLERDPVRVGLLVNGIVQGVGFRPTVYRFARAEHLCGFVKNTSHGVVIEIEGAPESIRNFVDRLVNDAPPLSRIESIEAEEVECSGGGEFTIEMSDEPGSPETLFPVDTSVCNDCLREMNDPADRRYRYPFINCTNCGPRFTIIEGLPYDRRFTTMNEFEMDDFCRAQYEDPSDRRFHAEPISCPDCGPSLLLVDSQGTPVDGDPIEEAQRLISEGKILAVKGLGGYHLACLASDDEVVERLRRRKKRPTKPFALMFKNIEEVERFCVVGEVERKILRSPQAPIVLLRKREAADGAMGEAAHKTRRPAKLSDRIAPNNSYIGAFLPYTPLHHLLLEAFDVLVMTSANFTDEPLISSEDELRTVLGAIADAALTHNRRIAHKCDDSILFVSSDRAVPVRRARGYVPEPVPLLNGPRRTILALGGQMKGTFAISKGGRAFLSAHLGDLGDYRSQKNFVTELEEFERLLELSPEVCVHDMHPDYFTTRLASRLDVPYRVAVQHHHAHAVSVMVEHGLKRDAIGVSFDGTGYGTDGRLWGGEFLLASPVRFKRLAHMKYVPLPGSGAAVYEPWRMALSFLRDAYSGGDGAGRGDATSLGEMVSANSGDAASRDEGDMAKNEFASSKDEVGASGTGENASRDGGGTGMGGNNTLNGVSADVDREFARLVERFFGGFPARVILDLIAKGVNSPLTSSIGRLFDAVAFLLGLEGRVSFEAEDAIALESLALSCSEDPAIYEFGLIEGDARVRDISGALGAPDLGGGSFEGKAGSSAIEGAQGASLQLDPGPLVRSVVDDILRGRDRSFIAASFHFSVARMIVDTITRLSEETGVTDIVLSGGVFQNRLLLDRIYDLAEHTGLKLHSHIIVPPNDGGISLGQIQIAASMLEEGMLEAD